MLIPPLVLCLGYRTKNELRKMPQTEPNFQNMMNEDEDEEEEETDDVETEDKNENHPKE